MAAVRQYEQQEYPSIPDKLLHEMLIVWGRYRRTGGGYPHQSSFEAIRDGAPGDPVFQSRPPLDVEMHHWVAQAIRGFDIIERTLPHYPTSVRNSYLRCKDAIECRYINGPKNGLTVVQMAESLKLSKSQFNQRLTDGRRWLWAALAAGGMDLEKN